MCLLKHALDEKKIRLSGKVKQGTYENKTPVLFKMEIKFVKTITTYMLKESSNSGSRTNAADINCK